RTWFLLLFIALGMVAAVVIACTIPLLSSVMTTAGLRSTLRATPESDEIAVYAGDPGISTPIVQAAYNEFAPLFRRYLGNTVQQTQFSTTINDFSFSPQRITYPYLSSLGLSGPVLGSNGQPGSLELLRDRVDV